MWLVYEGESIKICPICEVETHRKHCPYCETSDGEAVSLSGDKVMDKIMLDLSEGKDIGDIEKILKGEGEYEPLQRGAKA